MYIYLLNCVSVLFALFLYIILYLYENILAKISRCYRVLYRPSNLQDGFGDLNPAESISSLLFVIVWYLKPI